MKARAVALFLAALGWAAATAAPQRGIVRGRAMAGDGVTALHDLTATDVRTGQLARVAGDGQFEIEVDDLATARLRVAARGRATAEVRVVGRTALGVIVLPRGATISGTVTDTRGRRVASVPVRVVDALADLPFFPTFDDPPLAFVARATTRADGSFVVAGALPSAGRLVVEQAGGGETVYEPAEAGVPVEIWVPAVRPGVVRAVGQGGQGIPGVQVFVVDASGRRLSVGATDLHGVLLGQLPEVRGLSVIGEMVVGAVRVGTLPAALPATGLALDVVLRLQDPDLVETELRGPVERFTVQTWFGEEPAGVLPFAGGDDARVAAQGSVRLSPAPRGTPFVAQIRAPGRARTVVRGVTDGAEPVAFAMAREATVRGQVLDAVSGDPVVGVGILWVEPDALVRALELPIEVVTDAAGEFLLEGLPAGRGYVVARPPGGGRLATASIAVRAGERVDRLALRIDRGRLARGVVLDAPPGASVELRGDGGWRSEAELDDDGGFRCADAPFGATQVSLSIPSPVRLGAPRSVVLGRFEDGLDGDAVVRFDAAASLRPLRGRVDLGTTTLPRDRLAVFVEPITADGDQEPRHSLWFEGARAWVERGGGFETVARRVPSMVCVVDVATGVVLERIDRVECGAGDGPLDVGVLRMDVRRITVEVAASVRDRARRIDVDLGVLYPGGVGRMAAPSTITQLWERGTGLPLAAGRDGIELLLPAVEVEVRARSDRFGTPGDNIVARRRGTPVEGAVWVLEPVR